MRAVTAHGFSGDGPKLKRECIDASTRFRNFPSASKPRQILHSSKKTWFVFIDACYEPTSSDWKCGLGGIIYSPCGSIFQSFSVSLNEFQIHALGGSEERTIIFLRQNFLHWLLHLTCGGLFLEVVPPYSTSTTILQGMLPFLGVAVRLLQTVYWILFWKRTCILVFLHGTAESLRRPTRLTIRRGVQVRSSISLDRRSFWLTHRYILR